LAGTGEGARGLGRLCCAAEVLLRGVPRSGAFNIADFAPLPEEVGSGEPDATAELGRIMMRDEYAPGPPCKGVEGAASPE
jgi:hypothetical protein